MKFGIRNKYHKILGVILFKLNHIVMGFIYFRENKKLRFPQKSMVEVKDSEAMK